MSIDDLKARIYKPVNVLRQNVSMYPEIRALAERFGNGNISKGIAVALLEKLERESDAEQRTDAELAALMRAAADRLERVA